MAGDQSRHGSSQKPWRGTQIFSGGPIFHEKIVPVQVYYSSVDI